MNIIKLLNIELMKMKRKGLLLILAGASIFIVLVSFLPSLLEDDFTWHELLSASLFMYGMLLFQITSFITGSIFAGEYENNTMELIAASPTPMHLVIIAKTAAVICLLLFEVIFTCLFTIIAGTIFNCPGFSIDLFGNYLPAAAATMLIHMGFISFYIMISELGRKALYTAVSGIGFSVLAFLFLGKYYADFLPFCIPALTQFQILGKNNYTEFFRLASLPEVGFFKTAVIFLLLTAIPAIIIREKRKRKTEE